MRLPYAPSTPPQPSSPEVSDPTGTTETADIYTRIATRRHPRPLIPLDLTLLHSPPVADGWNSFLGALRSRTTLDSGILELAVCRVAVLNSAVYEWNSHAPLALKGGVRPEELGEVLVVPCTTSSAASSSQGQAVAGSSETTTTQPQLQTQPIGATSNTPEIDSPIDILKNSILTGPQQAVIRYTDQMTKNVAVEDSAFDDLKTIGGFSDREIVELTATIAGYNCVSRFLVALDVGENNGREMKGVEELSGR